MDIRTLRLEKGWTQKELAVKMNISLSTIKRWEKDPSIPRTNDSYMLRRLFGIKNKIKKEEK